MTEGLLRQRRSLMVTSMIIILLSFGGVKIEEVGALGTQLVFERKDALYIGMWGVFIYFLARYYQYLREEPDLGIATKPALRRQGIGTATLRRILELHNGRGIGEHTAIVAADNLAALRCAAKTGFILVSPQPDRHGYLQLRRKV